MKKPELVKKIAKMNGVTQVSAREALDMVFDSIRALVLEGESVEIQSFGKFYTVDVEARTRRNPMTGEAVEVPAGRRAKFKYSQKLKADVVAGVLPEFDTPVVDEDDED